MRKQIVTLTMLVGALVLAPQYVRADCPDEVYCYIEFPTGPYQGSSKKLGIIKTPTCYKFGKGCRPWHCSGYKDTDSTYWLNKCVERFDVKDNPAQSGEEVCVKFKGSMLPGQHCRKLD